MSGSERRKGKDGELEVAAIFRAAGFDCDRTPNSGGLRIRGDLHGELPAHVEVKRQETARPWAWWEQARAEAPPGVLPLVAFRRSRSRWLALVDLERLVDLLAISATLREVLETPAFADTLSRWKDQGLVSEGADHIHADRWRRAIAAETEAIQ